MKRILLRSVLLLALLLLVAGILALVFLDSLVKKGVETIGPKVTQVAITLDAAHISLLSGHGALKGLTVGNPAGYHSPTAIKVGAVSVAVKPASVLANKVVIESIDVQAPEITIEGGLKANNLSAILANVQAATASESQAPQPAPGKKGAGKKLEVDDFRITGGQIHLSLSLMGGKTATLPLPDIHLTGLGQGADGITPAELTEKVFAAVLQGATSTATEQLGKLGGSAVDAAKDVGSNTVHSVQKITHGIGDLFKKK